jgi:hypothetical protein
VKTSLYVAGALCELFGIALLAAPDFVPGALRAVGWIRVRSRQVENRVRRLLGLPRHATVVGVTGAASVSAFGQLSTLVETSETTVEGQVAFLLRRDRVTQEAISDVRARLDEVERGSERGRVELRKELRGHVSEALAAARADFRAARIWGAVLLVIGLGLSTWGNLA